MDWLEEESGSWAELPVARIGFLVGVSVCMSVGVECIALHDFKSIALKKVFSIQTLYSSH